jgi:hypothetical protein
MSTKANDLIERAEREAGCRIDDNGHDNNAMAIVFGALARSLGKSDHQERDDFAAGLLVRHQLTPEHREEQARKELMANMLMAGVDPDFFLK